MATLTLIGEPFPDIDARAQAAAMRCLAEAVAETAPRGCSSRLIVARDATAPTLSSARASVEAVPVNTGALPLLWRTGFAARPLDGEFVHAGTPLVPLRFRSEDDGSQTSVVVPHTLAWNAPELMGATQAKRYRGFVKRAFKLADVVLAPTHAVASELSERYGAEVQVLPLAAPTEFLADARSEETRRQLGLPEHYVATTAAPGDHGRLSWLLEGIQADASLPPLVVAHLGTEPLPPVRESLTDRVRVVQIEDLTEVGAIISGAAILALPQSMIGAGYEVLAALAARVPVLHAGCPAIAELALESAVATESENEFVEALTRLTSEAGAEEVQRLRLYADDRAQSFSWQSTAWRLWELHAAI